MSGDSLVGYTFQELEPNEWVGNRRRFTENRALIHAAARTDKRLIGIAYLDKSKATGCALITLM